MKGAGKIFFEVPEGVKRLSAAFLLLYFVMTSLPATCFAQGGRPGEVFNFGAGARPLGMGGAYTAVVRDATSLYYNPAGLSFMANRNVSFMHAMLYESSSYDYLGYAQNFSSLPGAWGAHLLRVTSGGGEGRDEYNNPTTGFSYNETAFAAGAGIRGLFLPFLSFGGSLKVLSRTLADSADKSLAFDLGAQYGPFYDNRLNTGIVIQNFGSLTSGDTSDKLPMGYKLGVSYALVHNASLCADISSGGQLRFGTEYVIGPGALRLGYDKTAFSFGGGLKFLKSYQFDLAMLKHETLGVSSRFSLGYYFGGVSAPPRIKTQAVNYVKKAEGELAGFDYVKAYATISLASGMDVEMSKGQWGERKKRLERLVTGLGLPGSFERQKSLKSGTDQALEANRAMGEYIYGNSLKSVLLAHSALGYQPNSAFYSELLTLLSKLSGVEKREDEILPRPALIQEKLNKVSSAFYIQQFETVIKQCEEVLLIDEKNSLAWTRLGSAYYAMGDMSKAKSAYEKAVALDPEDEITIRFMKMQGWR